MALKSFDELSQQVNSPLQPERQINIEQIQDWVREAAGKIDDAQRPENTSSTRMDAAYDAVLFASLAIAQAMKYRVKSKEGHHIVALEGAARAIGYTQAKFDEIDALREWRNRKYSAGFTARLQDMADAVATASAYLSLSVAWLQEKFPQIRER